MASEHDHTVTRIQVVETRLEHFATAIDKLTKAVENIAARPQQIAWREVATTAAVFLGLAAYVGNYLESQYKKNVAVIEYRLEQAEKTLRIVTPLVAAVPK